MAYPNLRQAIWLTSLLVLLELGIGLLISVVDSISGESLGNNSYVMGLVAFAALLLIVSYVSRRTDRRWVSFLRPAKSQIDWRVWPCVVFSIAGIVVVIHELNKALVCVFPLPESIQDIYQTTVGRGTSLPSALFLGTVVAPYVEEMFYRGIVLSGLLAKNTRTWAIIWSSILFAASHLDPWQFPATLVAGGVLAWWVIRTGSLWPAIVGHALNNLIFTTFSHFEIPYFALSDDLNVVAFNPWWWSAGGAVLAAIGLWWFHLVSNCTKHNALGGLLTANTGKKPE